jgi:hypothetical protein
VTATDVDTVGTLSYALQPGYDAALFTINKDSGVLALLNPADYETPNDANGDRIYDVTVVVSDGIQSTTQEIKVSVADVTEFGVTLYGINDEFYSGFSVSSAGDVNGDGIDDILIGAPVLQGNFIYAGETFVVFGNETWFTNGPATSIDLGTLNGTNGFVLNGIGVADRSGFSVSSAGDVNGDKIDDILIGAWGADPNGVTDAGETYVVFGKNTLDLDIGDFAASIDLSRLDGTDGFVLTGINIGDASGFSVSSAGDVNGDKIDDILIGAGFADSNGVTNAGETYVVFGKNTLDLDTGDFAASIDLSSLDGTDGFVLKGIDSFDQSGLSVSSAGDVNGDGIDDILIGAPALGRTSGSVAGETYVVFGKNTLDLNTGDFAASIDLVTLDGTNGFVLTGKNIGDGSGRSVSSAGDVNGDSIDDILIGTYKADPNGVINAGETYVVFGKNTLDLDTGDFAASIDLGTLDGANGFVLTGINISDGSGFSVSSAGDVNGDSIDDILIGTDGAEPNGTGETYLIFGKNTWGQTDSLASINLSSLLDGTDGFVFKGIDYQDFSGSSVSSAGDVNNDGFDDILIGAYLADQIGERTASNAGETYLVFGGADLLAAYDAADGTSDGSIELRLISDQQEQLSFV